MSDITTRSGKGSPLTNDEVDANFTNLNTDKLESGDLSVVTTAVGTAALAYNSGVFTYTPPDLTDIDLSLYAPLAGATFTGPVIAPTFEGSLDGNQLFKAKAGEAITKGHPVYISGISGNTPIVMEADADDPTKMPAFGLASDTVAINAAVNVVTYGQIHGLDTTPYALGAPMYVSTTPGGLSATAPTGESSLIQNMGKVERVHDTVGTIFVAGAGRTNATPNLNNGNFFLGNASNQSVSADFSAEVATQLAGTVVLGDVSTTGSVEIDGDLTVNGTTVTINATELALEDNMIYLNEGSAVLNPDLGIAGGYNDGTYAHAGIFRDATDGVWKIYDGYTLEPDASPYIDITHASFTLSDMQVNTLYADGGNSTEWNTAYDWGDHSLAGYLTSYVDTNTTYTAGTGLSLDGTVFSNSAPDQTVTLTGSGATTVTGTYPGFTISSTDTVYTHPSSHSISFITGLQTALDGKVDDSQVLTNVPAGAVFTDTVYTLPFTDYSTNWNTAYDWGDHSQAGYLPLAGGTLTGDLDVTGRVVATENTDAIRLRSVTNGVGVNINFSDHASGSYAQNGSIRYVHSDSSSYGSGNAFIVESTEPNMTFLADGKLMYKEGLYLKPATGTGAGTRKDLNWDTAYGWGNHASAGYVVGNTSNAINLTITGVMQANNGYKVGTSTVIDSSRNITAATVGVTNVVTNKVVKFNGTILDDSNITDTGSVITLGTSTNITGSLVSSVDITANGYLQATSYLYTRNDLRVLNAAGTGWTTWGTRSNGNYNLNVGTITATGGNSTNWNTAYGWGNHASAGYLPSSSYTASDVLTKIKTVDGSGSGLDADLLDGLELHTGRNNVANRVVRTDVNGYIQAGWINTTSGQTSNPITKIYGSYDGDDYLRWFAPSTIISQQGIWTSGNDGPGSGLNADLLDNQQGSYYLNTSTKLFKSGAEIAGSQDLNTYRTTGYYAQDSNADATSGSNYPALAAGILEVITGDQGNGLQTEQRYSQYNNNDKYVRHYYNGNWTAWARQWTSANDGPSSGLNADLLDGQHGSYYAPNSALSSYLPLSGGVITGDVSMNNTVTFNTDYNEWMFQRGNMKLRSDGNYAYFTGANGFYMAGFSNLYASNLTAEFGAVDVTGDVTAGGRVYIQGSTTNFLSQGPYSSTNLGINFGNAVFFYAGTQERMVLSSSGLRITSTGSVTVPVGTTAQRPTGVAGNVRYNSTLGEFEGYTTEWGPFGGAASATVHSYRYWRMHKIYVAGENVSLAKWVFFDDYDGQGNIVAGAGVTSGLTVTASHNSSTAYRASDNTTYMYWDSGLNDYYTYSTAWIRYAFSTPKTIKSMAVSYRLFSSTMYGGGNFVIQGSTDGSTWVDVAAPNLLSPGSQYETDPRNTFNLI